MIRREVEAKGLVHGFQLLTAEARGLPVPEAARMGMAPGAQALWLETLHLAGGAPFVYEARWLNPAVLPAVWPDFAAISVNEWLVAHVAFAYGDIAFSAEGADPRAAEVLGIAPGAACFVTERTTWTSAAAITRVRLVHAPGYCLQTRV